jgi:hypothetical protein
MERGGKEERSEKKEKYEFRVCVGERKKQDNTRRESEANDSMK